jgi:hypothetical protein
MRKLQNDQQRAPDHGDPGREVFQESTPAANQGQHRDGSTKAIVGEPPQNENDDTDFDAANEPSGDPAKNVPSA